MGDIDDETRDWIDAIEPILKAVRSRDGSEQTGLEMIEENFSVPGDAKAYMWTLAVLYDRLDAPNEKEYILSGTAAEGAVASKFNDFGSQGKIREKMVKAIYMMVTANQDWSWEDFVVAIEARLNDIDSLAEFSKDYRSLIECLLILAVRGGSVRAKDELENRRRRLYSILRQYDDHPSPAAASLMGLLLTHEEEKKAGRASAPPYNRRESTSSSQQRPPSNGETDREQVKKLIGDIVETPQSYPDVCKHLPVLLQRAGLELQYPASWNTERDLGPLTQHIQSLRENREKTE